MNVTSSVVVGSNTSEAVGRDCEVSQVKADVAALVVTSSVIRDILSAEV